MTKSRLLLALCVYAAIALLAFFTLDGQFRIAVWIFMGGLALKSWIATLRSDED